VNKNSNSIQDGGSKDEMTETLQASQSSNEESQSTSGISATTQSPKASQKDSPPTPNLRDAPNASRLIQALAAKLGKLVEWKKLTLGDGREVYALIFPTDRWQVDPVSKELLPR
jgi:hypothetical protein